MRAGRTPRRARTAGESGGRASRLAVRAPGTTPTCGYIAPCAACGVLVVHAASTGKPMHMHARSQRCRARANLRAAQWARARGVKP